MHEGRLPSVLMRTLIVANIRSGRGRAVSEAEQLRVALGRLGIDAPIQLIGGEHPPVDAAQLAGLRGLIVCGGDGTLNHLLEALSRSRTPVYHWACGNENLFARELGMRHRASAVARALRSGTTTSLDLGVMRIDDRPPRLFAIMMSLGPDAGVIQRLDSGPRSLPGHLAYITPVLREALRPTLPKFDVEVDGQFVAQGVRGMAVVANSRHYALRLDPAHAAQIDDGLLDAAVIACGTTIWWALGLAACWPRRLLPGLGGCTSARGRSVRIAMLDGPTPIQIDGESAGLAQRLDLTIQPKALRCLVASRVGSAIDAEQGEPLDDEAAVSREAAGIMPEHEPGQVQDLEPAGGHPPRSRASASGR
jgi:diacylglycerol kinase (ATP)